MFNNLSRGPHRGSGYEIVRSRSRQRPIDAIERQCDVAVTRIQARTEQVVAGIQARNAVGAAAAQADAAYSAILSALPIYDAMDADFRSQLKQATRAGVIADIYRFNP